MHQRLRGPADKWRFQIPSAKLVSEGSIPSPVVLGPCILQMTVAGNHGKARGEQTFLSCHLNPSPPVILPLALPLPVRCQGPADCCPLSSIKAISVEVTGACRLAQENLHADLHLNFFPLGGRTQLSLTCQEFGYYNACALLTLHTLIMAPKSMNIILHCLHDNDSGKVASHLCWWICMYRVGVA